MVKNTHTHTPLYTNECFEFGHGNTKAIYNRGAPGPPGRAENGPISFEKVVWGNATSTWKDGPFFPPLGGPPGGPPRALGGGSRAPGTPPAHPPRGGGGDPSRGLEGPPIAHFMGFADVGVMPKTIVRPKLYVHGLRVLSFVLRDSVKKRRKHSGLTENAHSTFILLLPLMICLARSLGRDESVPMAASFFILF